MIVEIPGHPTPECALERSYELPDGNFIVIGSERFRCPEALFDPSLIGRNSDGIADSAFNAIKKCDIDIQRDLFKNIMLSGGSTLVPDMINRMTQEIRRLAPNSTKVKVLEGPLHKNSAWEGGSIVASMSSFQDKLISKAEYNEAGPAIVHQKFS